MTAATEYVRSRQYELWKRVEGGVNDAAVWMVWEIGPDTGGEHWFRAEDEAREFIAEWLTDKDES